MNFRSVLRFRSGTCTSCTRSFLAIFHATILAPEKSQLEPTELYAVMTKLRKQLMNYKDDMFFSVKDNQKLEILPGRKVAMLDLVHL